MVKYDNLNRSGLDNKIISIANITLEYPHLKIGKCLRFDPERVLNLPLNITKAKMLDKTQNSRS